MFFEIRLKAAIRRTDVAILLEGNRVAALFNVDASYGKEFDVYRFRESYFEKFAEILRSGKSESVDPKKAALRLVSEAFKQYLSEFPGRLAKPFFHAMSLAASSAGEQLQRR